MVQFMPLTQATKATLFIAPGGTTELSLSGQNVKTTDTILCCEFVLCVIGISSTDILMSNRISCVSV